MKKRQPKGSESRVSNKSESAQEREALRKQAEEAVERYELLARHSRDIILFMRRDDGRILEANAAAVSAYGYTHDELLARCIHDLRAPETRGLTAHQMGEADRQGILFETLHQRKNGSTFPVEVSSQGATIGGTRTLISVIRDITARKRVQEALQESEERFHTLADAALEGVGISEHGRIVDANEQLLQIIGCTRSELIGQEVASLIVPEDRDRVMASILTGLESHTEHRMFRRDGTPITVETHGRTIPYQGRQVRITAIRDITERKRMEEALSQSEQLYRAISESIDYGVWVCAPDGRNIYASESFLNMVGLTQEQCSNFGWGDVLHPDDAERTIAAWKECVKTEGIWDIEHRFRGVDGQWHHVLARGTPVRDEQGKVTHWAGINLDISALKQAQLSLQEARAELELRVEERTEELRNAYEKLMEETRERRRMEEQLLQAQKMEAVGTLSGGIAHDFNNVLAAIIGFTELVIDDVSEKPDVRHKMDRVLKAAFRGRDLVRQILAFSRKSEGERKEISLTPLVKETQALLRGSLPSMIHMRLAITANDDFVRADSTQLQQVLMNLATNAAYAMRESGGELTIGVSSITFGPGSLFPDPDLTPGTYVQLTVQDTGMGMTEEVRKRAFEPFFTTKEQGKGTGMGLAVVYGIVKSHGGAVAVQSELGQGSVFSVFLPQAQQQEEMKEEMTPPLPKGTERILFVDDEELLAETMMEMLESLGYTVTAAQDGAQAWNLFLQDPRSFDLVVTDQTMPDVTGITLAQKMLKVRRGLPIILCTGYSELVSAEKAREVGISAFVMKPMTKKELAETVRLVLDKQTG